MGDTPKELQAEVSDLSRANAALNSRLSAVEERMGRIKQNPSIGDRFKAAFLPKKSAPLSKLSDEREQILQSLRANQKQLELASGKLDFVKKLDEPPKTTVGATLKQSKVGETPPSIGQGQSPLRSELGQEAYGAYGVEKPLRSDLGEKAYAASLGSESSNPHKEDPLRSDLGEKAYAASLGSESSNPHKEDPLRSDLGEKAYAASLGSESSNTPKEDPLRSELGERAYASSLGSETPSLQKESPLRSELGQDAYSSYGVERQNPDPSTPRTENPLRSDLPKESSYSAYGVETEIPQPSIPRTTESRFRSEPESPGSTKFKMKSMEDRYIEGEKHAPTTDVTIGGEEVTVQQKKWLRDQVNDERRKAGLPEFSEEMWEKSGLAGKQANTQYFNEEQRAKHGVTMEGGTLKSGSQKVEEGTHVFVMDGQGQIYASKGHETPQQSDDHGRKAHVHHSSFLAGEAVAGAGEIRVGKDGALKEVSDRSGHYKPGEEQTKQTLESIEQHGASLNNVKFTMDRGAEKTGGMAREFLQGQVTPEEQQHRAQQQELGKEVSDTSKVMEQTFKGRHNVADEIRGKGESVRDALHKTDNLKGLEHRAEEQAKKQGLGRVK